jgi:hypothetical protein
MVRTMAARTRPNISLTRRSDQRAADRRSSQEKGRAPDLFQPKIELIYNV